MGPTRSFRNPMAGLISRRSHQPTTRLSPFDTLGRLRAGAGKQCPLMASQSPPPLWAKSDPSGNCWRAGGQASGLAGWLAGGRLGDRMEEEAKGASEQASGAAEEAAALAGWQANKRRARVRACVCSCVCMCERASESVRPRPLHSMSAPLASRQSGTSRGSGRRARAPQLAALHLGARGGAGRQRRLAPLYAPQAPYHRDGSTAAPDAQPRSPRASRPRVEIEELHTGWLAGWLAGGR